MLLYLSFLFTFFFTGIICLIFDLFIIKGKKFKNKFISRNELIYQYKTIFPTILFNAFVVLPIVVNFSEYYYITETAYETFSIYNCIIPFLFASLSLDLFFYICHFLLHNKLIYKWSHKQHHEFKYPVGMEALYLHWFDLCFGNILPLYLPIFLFNSHLYTIIIWNIFIVSSTVLNAHSSFKDNNHINHHIFFNVNYGTGLYMDTLLGTTKPN